MSQEHLRASRRQVHDGRQVGEELQAFKVQVKVRSLSGVEGSL